MIKRLAPDLNAFTCHFDPLILQNIYSSYATKVKKQLDDSLPLNWHQGGTDIFKSLKGSEGDYFVASYGTNPLMWVSCDSEPTYRLYEKFFGDLCIQDELKTLIDYDKSLRVYCGFLVVGRQADKPIWHVDYKAGAQAQTLITPLLPPDPKHGNLMYRDATGVCRTYHYRFGEAIFFGDGFLHSTQPYTATEENRVLLSLTFGSDKDDHWNCIEKTVGTQSRYLAYPDGSWRYNRLLASEPSLAYAN